MLYQLTYELLMRLCECQSGHFAKQLIRKMLGDELLLKWCFCLFCRLFFKETFNSEMATAGGKLFNFRMSCLLSRILSVWRVRIDRIKMMSIASHIISKGRVHFCWDEISYTGEVRLKCLHGQDLADVSAFDYLQIWCYID